MPEAFGLDGNRIVERFQRNGMGRIARKSIKEESIKMLEDLNIQFYMPDPNLIIIRCFNFWPSTGLYIHRETGKRSRGILNLLKEIGT